MRLEKQGTARYWLNTPLAILVVLALGIFIAPAIAQEPPESGASIKVNVRLVMVPASVSSPEGESVTNLTQASFEVFEEGELRPIRVFEKSDNLPLQMILLIDTSLSAAKELPAEKDAMARFIRRVLRREDSAALIEMAGDARTVVDFSADANHLEESLEDIKARAGTALYDTLLEAAVMLEEREGRKVMVLITDGNDTTSRASFREALDAVTEIDAAVFALVVRPIAGESGRSVRGEHVLIQLADMTGGQVFFPAGAEELDKFFDELSDVLRTQYIIGIVPAPTGYNAEYRNLVVKVKGEDYHIRHRKGYFTGATR
jgi:Ca-activated chloride channel family protein